MKMTKFVRGEVPKTKAFQFADMAELLLLVGEYDEISHSELEATVNQGTSDTDPDDRIENDVHAVDINRREQGYIKACFNHLAYRVDAFDDIYPFELKREVLNKKRMIGQKEYVYLFLLGCSRLASFDDLKFRQECARLFVDLSAIALKNLLPAHAKIWVFDANSIDRAQYFTNNLRVAIRKLGIELSERCDEIVVNQQEVQGDGGLDLVGVQQFNDSGRGYITFFGQCAAQQDGWPRKTLETRKLNLLFNFSHQPYNLNFIPVLYRQGNGSWVNEVYTNDCILLDRLRIIRALFRGMDVLPAEIFQRIHACVNVIASSGIKEQMRQAA